MIPPHSEKSSSLSLQPVLFSKWFLCILHSLDTALCVTAFGAMATTGEETLKDTALPVTTAPNLEETLKEYLSAMDVFNSMGEVEYTNLQDGIKKGDYHHIEEVFADISELGVAQWIDSMSKACNVRELGAVKRFATYVAEGFRNQADSSSKQTRTPSAQRDKSRSRSRSTATRGGNSTVAAETPSLKGMKRERLSSRSRSRSKSRRPDALQPAKRSIGELGCGETLKETETAVDTTLEEVMRMRLRRSCTVVVKLVHVPRKVETFQKSNKTKIQLLLASPSTSAHLQAWGKEADELISRTSKLEGQVVKLEDVRFDDFKNVPFLKPGKRFNISAPPAITPPDFFDADAVFTSFSSFATLPPYSRCSIQGVVRSAGEAEAHENSAGLQRHLTDVELVDQRGYLLRVSVWSNSPVVFEVNRKIRIYNVQVNKEYQRGEVSDYSGWHFGSRVPDAQQPREVFVLKWEQSS